MEDLIIWGLAFFVTSILPGIAAKHVQEMRTRRNMEALEKEWRQVKEEKEHDK